MRVIWYCMVWRGQYPPLLLVKWTGSPEFLTQIVAIFVINMSWSLCFVCRRWWDADVYLCCVCMLKQFERLYRKNSTLKDVNFCSPRFFSFFGEKLPKSSGITHMVTSNGGHPLQHHLRHTIRLSNSLFNRRTTKPTFTQWPQASTL